MENIERKFCDSLLNFNIDYYSKIVSIPNQALNNANQRKKHLEAEKDSITDCKIEFE
ncbi:YkyA family protein [Bacillus vallismortis]|uniref:YkyA family protein n=1 Tax=Bacillus vallismortis TaxID=72361 RepID=A0ABY4Y2V9_BACVA|nr:MULTISPECIES: YkyA family protein [Bacillus]USP96948.1 YkyA family protein [Bacillus vallismortis]